MTADEMREARETLGFLWGLERPLFASELARVLRLTGRDPGRSILDYESGKTRISGPLSVAIEMMTDGAIPPTYEDVFDSAPLDLVAKRKARKAKR